MKPTRAVVCFSLALLLLGRGAGSADGRVWTSAAGSQVEAELAEVQGDSVILRAPDGRQFRIGLDQLSEPDQAFIRESLAPREQGPEGDAVPAPLPTPSRRPAPPEPEQTAPDSDVARLTGTNAYAAPPPLSSDALPGLSTTNLPFMALIGLQYGPAGDHVLYCAFESPNPQRPPTHLHLFSPGAEPYRKTVTQQARTRRVEEERVSLFRDIRVTSGFDDIQLAAELEFICGIGRPDTVLLMATVQLQRDRTASSFIVGGYLNNDISVGPSTVKAVPILGRPGLGLQAFPPRLNGYVSFGRLSLIPESGMDTTVLLEALDPKNDRVIDRAKVSFVEEQLARGAWNRTFFHTFSNLPRGRPYAIKATLDLGPFLGTVERRIDFKGSLPPEGGPGRATP